ncbi:hypothetical protein BACT_1327 [Bifidobacterium actinocoloniiforme DSM 22766]|uniref:Uncharacterized protein n=1 Tax=Bifidobacterium actinocoloniiforme DSM 22766 TaxID=1437605 RepID=A0A086Z273_9BIFI|nr:hypothetical protein AB656_07230 [Bifidobacterium actinocoloniiforme DSM 22766]KFI40623.1 hypothetical protein BACT_1327 [Bifidobacterium actinocoloniiforme DSM 22766]
MPAGGVDGACLPLPLNMMGTMMGFSASSKFTPRQIQGAQQAVLHRCSRLNSCGNYALRESV